IVFFFSSRRRHTRSKRDWSSDVCSSDLLKICRQNVRRNSLTARVVPIQADAREKPEKSLGEFQCIVSNPPYIPRADIATLDTSRSEERRVGKECRRTCGRARGIEVDSRD